ncbi:MAG: FAD/NAD(P)-binding protein, partial [Caldilineaceae bacterium]|nr:FAD/NAD(P)-binding protein [Caldilineaceae bacterium]
MSELPDCTHGWRVYRQPRVGIIGAGFSGLLVLAHLVEQADFPLAIELFEAERTPGTGVAYRTTEPRHLLNVRADRMGAFASEPEGFYRWLQSPQGQAAAARHDLPMSWVADSYAPRLLYGY